MLSHINLLLLFTSSGTSLGKHSPTARDDTTLRYLALFEWASKEWHQSERGKPSSVLQDSFFLLASTADSLLLTCLISSDCKCSLLADIISFSQISILCPISHLGEPLLEGKELLLRPSGSRWWIQKCCETSNNQMSRRASHALQT